LTAIFFELPSFRQEATHCYQSISLCAAMYHKPSKVSGSTRDITYQQRKTL